jgi:hypothetical protein
MAANKALKLTIPPLAGPPPSLSGLGGLEVPTRVTGSFGVDLPKTRRHESSKVV